MNTLLDTDISPFPKQTDLKGPFLVRNPPFNLLLGTKKCAKMSVVRWYLSLGGWLPAMASPATAKLSGSGQVVSTLPGTRWCWYLAAFVIINPTLEP